MVLAGIVNSVVCLSRQAALAQSVERLTRNEQVCGSIPQGGSGPPHSIFNGVCVRPGLETWNQLAFIS